MSLIGFHKILIGAGILFCAGFAAWQVLAFSGDGSWFRVALAATFVAFTVALGVYLARLDRYLGREEESGS